MTPSPSPARTFPFQNIAARRRNAHAGSRAPTASRRPFRAAPQSSAGFVHAGFCLHQIGRTREAKALLLRGPTALLKEPIYYYHTGCYEVLLGNLKGARVHLQISLKMDSSFRDLAKRDPDLRPLHATL